MASPIIFSLIVGIVVLVVLPVWSGVSMDSSDDQVNRQRAVMATSITVGAAIGTALGGALDNMALMAVGVASGVAWEKTRF